MSNEPYILITADTHAGGSHAQYREYLDPEYRERFDEWRGGYKNPSQEHYGTKKLRNWDLEIRTKDQNSQGVVGEVVGERGRDALVVEVGGDDDQVRTHELGGRHELFAAGIKHLVVHQPLIVFALKKAHAHLRIDLRPVIARVGEVIH